MEQKESRKVLFNLLKIFLSLALLYFVFRKIPLKEVAKLWQSVNIFWLFPAAIFFLLSQIISTKRLELFFSYAGFPLSFRSNLELYFLGMFYNFFIPGGIGGDAYKIYLLNKKFSWKTKTLTSALFNDRLSGLFAICLLICILGFLSLHDLRIWAAALFIVGSLGIFFISKKIFPTFKTIFPRALLYSFGVQILQVLCFIFLLKSLGISGNYLEYSLLFLASSVLSLVSFAGIGVREMLFLQASKYFSFNPAFSISASLLFTSITALFSLAGLFFQIRKVNLELSEEL